MGLEINSVEFEKLPRKQQLRCLFENQVETLKLIKSYKFHQKVQYPWLLGLTASAVFIIKLLLRAV